MKPYHNRFEALSKDLKGEISKSQRFFYDTPCFIGSFSGHKFSLTYWHSDGAPPKSLQLRYYISSLNNLKIFAYTNPMTVLFAKRVQLSDEPFNKYFIYSNKPNDARLFLNSESRKKSIYYLIDHGWSFPHITAKYIYLSADVDHSLDPEELKSTLTQIIELKT